MKRLHFTFLLLLALGVSLAQAQVSVETTSGITTAITGGLQITLDGNWTNNGTLTPGSSTVTPNGTGAQTITNASGSFNNLTINKASGETQAAGNFTVDGTFTLTSGDVDLNGNIITLGTNALLAETPGNTVKGTSGHLETTRDLNAPNADNVAGLGFEITSSADLGSTVIQRGHAQQSGNGNESILRYFDVTPTDNSGLNATLAFHYDESELDGQTEANLSLYKSEDSGSSWMAQGGTPDAGANAVTLSGVEAFSRWTVADQSLAFAEVFADAGVDQAICAGESVQIGGSPTASGGESPYSYSWSPATGLDDDTAANPTASPATTTQYIVTVTDDNNQTAKDTMLVTINPAPVADAGSDKNIAPGGNVQIGGSPTASSGTAPYTYAWSPATGLDDDTAANPTASPSATTEYIVVVTDNNGCSDSDTVLVTVTEPPAIAASKTVTLLGDANLDGNINPGDTLQYSVVISNTGAADAENVVFSDLATNLSNASLVPGSVTTTTGSITSGNGSLDTDIVVAFGTLAASSGSATVTFSARIDSPFVDTVREVCNQGAVSGSNFASVLTDDPNVGGANDATCIGVTVLSLVNNMIQAKVKNSHWNASTNQLIFELAIKNISSTPISAPLQARIDELNPAPPTITVNNADNGVTGLGAIFDYSDKLGSNNVLSPNETSGYKTWIFDDPSGVNFTFFANVFGNLPPETTSAIKAAKLARTSQSGAVSQATEKGLAFYVNTSTGESGLAKSLDELNEKLLPAEFTLFQNYPNPFNPETKIRFSLPKAASVKLVIYNLLGQEIKALVNEDKAAGSYDIIWNGRDKFGQPVASGIYIYRIVAGEFSQVRKLTLVR